MGRETEGHDRNRQAIGKLITKLMPAARRNGLPAVIAASLGVRMTGAKRVSDRASH